MLAFIRTMNRLEVAYAASCLFLEAVVLGGLWI